MCILMFEAPSMSKYFIVGKTKIVLLVSFSYLLTDVHYYPFFPFYTSEAAARWMNPEWNPKGIANSFKMSKQKLKE